MASTPEHPQTETAQPLQIPEIYLIAAKRRLLSMMPDEMLFTSPDSVVIDENTDRLLIDTHDRIIPPIVSVSERFIRPAIIRIVKTIGSRALDGYIVDYRYIKIPQMRQRSDETTGRPEDKSDWLNFRTQNPLGVVLPATYDEKTVYLGLPELEETAFYFAKSVDSYLEAVEHGVGHENALERFQENFNIDKNVLE